MVLVKANETLISLTQRTPARCSRRCARWAVGCVAHDYTHYTQGATVARHEGTTARGNAASRMRHGGLVDDTWTTREQMSSALRTAVRLQCMGRATATDSAADARGVTWNGQGGCCITCMGYVRRPGVNESCEEEDHPSSVRPPAPPDDGSSSVLVVRATRGVGCQTTQGVALEHEAGSTSFGRSLTVAELTFQIWVPPEPPAGGPDRYFCSDGTSFTQSNDPSQDVSSQ